MATYATAQDVIDRYGNDALLLLADRDNDGVVESTVIDTALADAGAEMDAYLAVRYTLPFATPPALLVHLCVDIAVYRLAAESDVATDERRRRFDDALLLLTRLSSGEASFGIV
jgi:phage gp36-like protein